MAIEAGPLQKGIDFIITNVFERAGDFVYNFFLTYSRPILNAMHVFFDTTFYIILEQP